MVEEGEIGELALVDESADEDALFKIEDKEISAEIQTSNITTND